MGKPEDEWPEPNTLHHSANSHLMASIGLRQLSFQYLPLVANQHTARLIVLNFNASWHP
jgi:hypothetical protein